MLCGEIIAVCSEIHTEPRNVLCGQNVELLNVKLVVQNYIYRLSPYRAVNTLPLGYKNQLVNPLTPIDHYSGPTAPLTSKRCILCIYSTNIGTEYFTHVIYSTFFSLQNAVCFIILIYLVPVLFTFYIQYVLKLKKIIPGQKG